MLWAPFLLQKKNDLLPLLCREVGSPTFAASSGSGIAVCQLCAVVGIMVGSIARELAADGTGRSAQAASDLRIGFSTYQEAGNSISFLLRELVISIHVASLSWRKRMPVVSQLSHFFAIVLHLLVESTAANSMKGKVNCSTTFMGHLKPRKDSNLRPGAGNCLADSCSSARIPPKKIGNGAFACFAFRDIDH